MGIYNLRFLITWQTPKGHNLWEVNAVVMCILLICAFACYQWEVAQREAFWKAGRLLEERNLADSIVDNILPPYEWAMGMGMAMAIEFEMGMGIELETGMEMSVIYR